MIAIPCDNYQTKQIEQLTFYPFRSAIIITHPLCVHNNSGFPSPPHQINYEKIHRTVDFVYVDPFIYCELACLKGTC